MIMKKFIYVFIILDLVVSFSVFSQSAEKRPRTEEYCLVRVKVLKQNDLYLIQNSKPGLLKTFVSPIIEMDTVSFRLTQENGKNLTTLPQLFNFMNTYGWEVMNLSFEDVTDNLNVNTYRNYVIFFKRKYVSPK
jgi:hypothetical protein